MLQDSQLDAVEDWTSCEDRQQKKRIKDNLAKSLYQLHYLRELPPDESREIIQDALGRFDEDDWSTESDVTGVNVPIPDGPHDDWEEDKVNRNAYVCKLFAVLFNGLSEEDFNTGVNKGTVDAVRWRAEDGDTLAQLLMEFLETTSGGTTATEDPLWEVMQDPGEQIDQVETWVSRVLALETGSRPDKDTVELVCTEIDGEIPAERIDLPQEPEIPEDRDEAHSRALYNYHSKWEKIKLVFDSQKKAEKMALDLSYPRNAIDDSPAWMIREYLLLHQKYLEEEDAMPDYDKLPDGSISPTGIRNPTLLNLKEWTLGDKQWYGGSVDVIDEPE